MQRAHVLDLPPRKKGEWPEPQMNVTPLPGRVHMVSMKVPETASGLVMTDRERHSCDLARVVASGVEELPPGTTVLLIAGTGVYTDDLNERILGTGNWRDGMPDPWEFCIPARLEGFHWVLSEGWGWVKKVPQNESSSLIALPDRLDKYRINVSRLFGVQELHLDLTAAEIAERGWDLFRMKRAGGFERFLVRFE